MTGLSFFLINERIQAIHGHTKRGSQALEAYQRLHSLRKTIPDWVYIPITANDKVISIGTVRTIANLNHPSPVIKRIGPITSYSIVVRCPTYRLQLAVNLMGLVNHEIWEIFHRVVLL